MIWDLPQLKMISTALSPMSWLRWKHTRTVKLMIFWPDCRCGVVVRSWCLSLCRNTTVVLSSLIWITSNRLTTRMATKPVTGRWNCWVNYCQIWHRTQLSVVWAVMNFCSLCQMPLRQRSQHRFTLYSINSMQPRLRISKSAVLLCQQVCAWLLQKMPTKTAIRKQTKLCTM